MFALMTIFRLNPLRDEPLRAQCVRVRFFFVKRLVSGETPSSRVPTLCHTQLKILCIFRNLMNFSELDHQFIVLVEMGYHQ